MRLTPTLTLPLKGRGCWMLIAVLVAAMACSAEPTPTLPVVIVPPPTATPTPPGATASPTDATVQPSDSPTAAADATPAAQGTPVGPTETPAYPAPPSPLNANDLDFLPDDPTALMYAALDQSLVDVGRKMAYSHNTAYIPVLLEFMRFQQNEEALLTLASFMVRIREKIPEEEFTIVPDGEGSWDWWQKWLAQHPEVTPPEGYGGWKGQLFGFIDPAMGEFMYDGVPATIRLEEIVWGGVRRDGIPDLRFPPHLSPEEASYLQPGDRVFGVSINGEHRAYPLRVLNAHEMANDIVGGVQFALAY